METLKEFLKTSGSTQAELAKDVGCSPAAISMFVSGKRRPSPDLALKICRATGGQVSVIKLLFGTEKSLQGRDVA
jgi:transcriptional regulator with XRE-family HTH domain